jgi:hypothetical protein
MFFHAMGGRCGTIDTAIKTADSGYISRKLIKAAEDLMIHYDMTVRNASNNIIQFAYGDDNMDPTKLEKVNKIDLIEKNNEEIENMYKFDDLDNKAYFETFMTKEAVDRMFEEPNYKSYMNLEYKEIIDNRNILRNKYFKYTEAIGDIKTFVPINLFRVMASQILKFNIQKGIIELEKNFGIDPKPIPMKTNFIEFKKWFDSNSRVINEQVKTLTLGSKGGAMINPGGNRPGHFNFVVKKVLGKNKYMVTISKWEFGSEYAKVGDSGTLTVGNKDATLNINGQVIDQLMMD